MNSMSQQKNSNFHRTGGCAGLHSKGAWSITWTTLVWLILIPSVAIADFLLTGSVTDIFDRPVVGANVTVRNDGASLQDGITDSQGKFSLRVAYGQSGVLSLRIVRTEYVDQSIQVVVDNYDPIETSYLVNLLPSKISACSGSRGAIYVGRFLPPISDPATDLTPYVSRVLSERIIPQMQIQGLRTHLDPANYDLLPEFRQCSEAEPATRTDGKPLAQALGGHGLVWGAIEDGSAGKFHIKTHVIDAATALSLPQTTTSENVDLAHSSNAVISNVTQIAVLVSVMSNLQKLDQCQAAIYISNEIDRIESGTVSDGSDGLSALLVAASDIKAACQRRLPHAGLLTGSST